MKMAEIFRPTYTIVDPQTGKRTKRKSKRWWVRYYLPGGERRKVKGYPDRKATESLASELERRAIREHAGLTDPTEVHAKRPLDEHLAEYRDYLTAKGNTPKHVGMTESRICAVLDGCGFVKIGDVQPSTVVAFLAELRTREEDPRSTTTANYYLTAIKGFTRWLWKDRRILIDPLAGLSKLATNGDAVTRSDFSADELRRLVEMTGRSEWTFRGLTGAERAALYLTAASTGLRASELRSLTPERFDLSGDPAHVIIDGRHAKNGKTAIQPLARTVAKSLTPFLASKVAGTSLWPGQWHRRAAKMIRSDLKAAGIEADGRDFHCLRHSYVSELIRSGASVKTVQTLARHSTPTLTLGRYAHAGVYDLRSAVDALPSLTTTGNVTVAKATGTDGRRQKLGPFLGPVPAKTRDSERRPETKSGDVSQSKNSAKHVSNAAFHEVESVGLEPTTTGLKVRCSTS
jgi:integrase